MTFILIEYAWDTFVFDLMNIEFSKTFSSLVYFSIFRFEDKTTIDFDILYFRQLRHLVLLAVEKILKIK